MEHVSDTNRQTPLPRFKDRAAAAHRIAVSLAPYRDRRPLVLGIPAGGAVMANVLARDLGGDLDVALVKTLVAPAGAAMTIGAVAESGFAYLQEGWSSIASESFMKTECDEALGLLRRLRQGYTPQAGPIDPSGRLVILVDDGVASIRNLMTVLLSLREAGAEVVVAASAVASVETVESLRRDADVVTCLRTLEPFGTPSSYYESFGDTSDRDIREFLRKASRKPFHRGIA